MRGEREREREREHQKEMWENYKQKMNSSRIREWKNFDGYKRRGGKKSSNFRLQQFKHSKFEASNSQPSQFLLLFPGNKTRRRSFHLKNSKQEMYKNFYWRIEKHEPKIKWMREKKKKKHNSQQWQRQTEIRSIMQSATERCSWAQQKITKKKRIRNPT